MAFDFSNPFANVNTASPTPPVTPTPVPKSNPPAPAADKKSSADLLAKPLKTDMGGDVISQFQKDYLAGEKAKADLLVKQAQNKEAAYQPLLAEREAGVGSYEERIKQIGNEMAKPVDLPKETVGEFAQLGSLVGVLGMMLGKAGKQSANGALMGMTGMINGYRQGRTDLYERAKKEYEMNMKRLQGMSSQVQTELALYLEKAKTKEAGAQLHLDTANAIAAGGVAPEIAKGGMADKIADLKMQLAKLNQAAAHHNQRINIDIKVAQQEYQQAEQNYRTILTQKAGNTKAPEVIAAQQAVNNAKAKLDALSSGSATTPSTSGARTPQDVANDFKSGKITREQAEKELRDMGISD